MENNKPRLMLLDDFGGQKTSKVLKALNSVNFTTSFIPEGCTSYVQPIDTALNKTFKKKISEQEMDQNPAKWDDSEKFCVGDRWISVTNCVGEVWDWLHKEKGRRLVNYFVMLG